MSKKKKILLLSDDIRMHSGISTMGRELVLGTVQEYDWVQLAAAIKHPDKGKIFDMSNSVANETGVADANVKLYPNDGYGDANILNQLIHHEKPDAILHFTDPRFWGWLYNIEREIRQKIPLTYLNIWDDVPYPMWNRPFYKSCDALFSISKQTLNINKFVLGEGDWVLGSDVKSKKSLQGKSLLQYVPHGINSEMFKPIDLNNPEFVDFKNKVIGKKEYKYILFYNNRNIRRKQASNIIMAYRMFCDSLPKKEADKCLLLMHTAPVDNNGTNLHSVVSALCPKYDVKFSITKLSPNQMNYLYNIADVTVNAASNEGFGLSGAESIMTGTPIINNCTGGLQDHMGYVDENGNPVEFRGDWGTNSDCKYPNHGKWAYAVYPAIRNIQGSPPTPYIFDEPCRWEDIAHGMKYWYLAGDAKRKEFGLLGREWAMGEGGLNSVNMCNQFIEGMNKTLKFWTPRSRVSIHTEKEYVGHSMPNGMGFEVPQINDKELTEKLLSL